MKRGAARATSSQVSYSMSWTSSTFNFLIRLSACGSSQGVPRRLVEPTKRSFFSRLPCRPDAYRDPWSEWNAQPGSARLSAIARRGTSRRGRRRSCGQWRSRHADRHRASGGSARRAGRCAPRPDVGRGATRVRAVQGGDRPGRTAARATRHIVRFRSTRRQAASRRGERRCRGLVRGGGRRQNRRRRTSEAAGRLPCGADPQGGSRLTAAPRSAPPGTGPPRRIRPAGIRARAPQPSADFGIIAWTPLCWLTS